MRKNSMLPILIGCEESQVICAEFRKAGFEAYSCDLKPTRGNPEWHFQQDIMQVIPTRRWSLIILHPDCTAMAVSGNRWYGVGMPRHAERKLAVEWTLKLLDLAIRNSDKVALENPVSVIFTHLQKQNVHYIQPWMFGHGETKKRALRFMDFRRFYQRISLMGANSAYGRWHLVRTGKEIEARHFQVLRTL